MYMYVSGIAVPEHLYMYVHVRVCIKGWGVGPAESDDMRVEMAAANHGALSFTPTGKRKAHRYICASAYTQITMPNEHQL